MFGSRGREGGVALIYYDGIGDIYPMIELINDRILTLIYPKQMI